MWFHVELLPTASRAGIANNVTVKKWGASLMSVHGGDAAVKKALHNLVKALLAADKAALEAGVAEQLSFGHADGHIQSKADLVAAVTSKRVIYKSVRYTEPTVIVLGNTAIVRHIDDIDVEAGGNVASLKLGILQVYVNEGGLWKLLAHQAAPYRRA